MTANPSSSGDEELIARFMHEFDDATDPVAFVEQWCSAHPSRADDFRMIAAGHARLLAAAPTPMVATPRLTKGEMLGEFKIVRYMTRGGMGEIYEAEQITLSKRRVALKVMRRGQVSPDARARFMREQEALSKLHQTNIVPVFAAGERDELQYFAMQYIDGATLGHVINWLKKRHGVTKSSSQTPSLGKLIESVAGKSFDPSAATASNSTSVELESASPEVAPMLTEDYLRSVASSLADVGDALASVHQANVLHRDVKPSNLMAERSGKCWVIDFGLADLVAENPVGQVANSSGEAQTPSLTWTGAVLGTLPYMAPEQLEGRPEARSDAWALGVTLYEMLTLRRPFPGPTQAEFEKQIKNIHPPRPSTLAKVPTDLEAICLKALSKNPIDRYATCADFAVDLRHWLSGEPTNANPPWAPRRVAMWAKRQPGWASMLGVACLAMLMGIGLVLQMQRHRTVAAQRQLAILRFEQNRNAPRLAGWRNQLLPQAKELAVGGQEAELRDAAVDLLSGLDARYDPTFVEGPATAVAFDPTSRRLLMAGYDDPADKGNYRPTRVRDVTTAESKESTQRNEGPIGWRGEIPVQLVPPTKEHPTIVLWNVDTNKVLEAFTLPTAFLPALDLKTDGITLAEFALSADARTVVALVWHRVSGERTLLIWRTGQPNSVATILVPGGQAAEFGDKLTLSSDGSLLALAGEDGLVRVWTTNVKPLLLAELKLGHNRVTALAFGRHPCWREPSPPGRTPGRSWYVARGDGGGRISVWDLDTDEPVMDTGSSEHEVFGLAFSPDGTTLASCGRGEGALWNIASSRRLLRLHPPKQPRNWMPGVAFSPDGSALAICSIPHFDLVAAVDLYHLEAGRGIQSLRGLVGVVQRIAITPDGRFAAGLTQRWQTAVWSVSSGELLLFVDVPPGLYADSADIRLTADGRSLIVASGKLARRWQIPESGSLIQGPESWPLNPGLCNRVGITAEGKILLCRYETLSGKHYPTSEVPWTDDPRCVRTYELQIASNIRLIATHLDLARHVNLIHTAPDGGLFLASGFGKDVPRHPSIFAYDGESKERLWQIDRPATQKDVVGKLDASGRLLDYQDEESNHWLRSLPYRNESDIQGNLAELVTLSGHYAVLQAPDRGLPLSRPGTGKSFLTLSPDAKVMTQENAYTVDGRYIAWGTADGTVHVADMETIRKHLVTAGFPGW